MLRCGSVQQRSGGCSCPAATSPVWALLHGWCDPDPAKIQVTQSNQELTIYIFIIYVYIRIYILCPHAVLPDGHGHVTICVNYCTEQFPLGTIN